MTLEKLKNLLEAGAITQEEYDAMAAALPEHEPDPEPVIDDALLQGYTEAT